MSFCTKSLAARQLDLFEGLGINSRAGIDIDALAARYDDPAFWQRALLALPENPLA
jgi:hypothetical protein